MRLVEMTDEERAALTARQEQVRDLRAWKRLQAVRLLAEGREAGEVAQVLGCSTSAVYYWAEAWREERQAGLEASPHGGGRPRRLDGPAEGAVQQLLDASPQTHGYAATDWTVPLLGTDAGDRCWPNWRDAGTR